MTFEREGVFVRAGYSNTLLENCPSIGPSWKGSRMDPVLRHLLFCDSVVPLLEGKLVSYGIFTDLFAERFPLTYPKFSILVSWTQAPGFHIQQIKMLNPARSLIMHQSPESYFTLNDACESASVIVDVHQVVFTEPGAYLFEVYLDNRPMGEFQLQVRQRSPR